MPSFARRGMYSKEYNTVLSIGAKWSSGAWQGETNVIPLSPGSLPAIVWRILLRCQCDKTTITITITMMGTCGVWYTMQWSCSLQPNDPALHFPIKMSCHVMEKVNFPRLCNHMLHVVDILLALAGCSTVCATESSRLVNTSTRMPPRIPPTVVQLDREFVLFYVQE